MKKFPARPAASAFARNAAFPIKPFCRVVSVQPAAFRHANANGFGFCAAKNDRLLAFVQLGPVYLAASLDEALFTPLKYARKIGRGVVPGAPVYANVAPRPAAMFALRLACAFLNSLRNPLPKISNSL